jgi:hypothetical protein
MRNTLLRKQKQFGEKKSWHHRKPRSIGGSDEMSNLSRVSNIMHKAWHTLFRNLDAHAIVRLINDVWIDPAYTLIVVPREVINKNSSQRDFIAIQKIFRRAYKVIYNREITSKQLLRDSNRYLSTGKFPQYVTHF